MSYVETAVVVAALIAAACAVYLIATGRLRSERVFSEACSACGASFGDASVCPGCGAASALEASGLKLDRRTGAISGQSVPGFAGTVLVRTANADAAASIRISSSQAEHVEEDDWS
jgi:hypothetical protein